MRRHTNKPREAYVSEYMITVVLSSGRKNSNSSGMANRLAAAAVKAGGAIERYDLAKMDFKGCTGCGSCRSTTDSCVIRDDLSPLLASLKRCDAVVLASPNYYGYVSGTFKAFLDRWYSLRDAERKLRLPAGRPLAFLMSQGHPDPEGYQNTLNSMSTIFSAYGFETKTIIGAGLQGPGEFTERQELLSELDAFGEELSATLRKSK
ncbi:MAG: hypothetical protein C0608_02275 [Deltaproteobacteria bacterium]|nr:MAG: hypothetical protein C0608_02275 [Deltaproteobacteria bacterium]